MKTAHQARRGFTLIELMIIVAVIGILAAIAYPSYQEHVRKARRADAQTALLELAQFMERYYTANGRYRTGAGAAPALPFAWSPKDAGNVNTAFYTLGFQAIDDTTYTLQAVPRAGTMMAGDGCGTLRLANTGAKTRTGTLAMDRCWRR